MDTDDDRMDVETAGAACADIVDAVGEAVVGDERFFERLLVALLSRGHVLVEDVPGTGKTLTARTLATALGLEFSRVQFTPDLLPSDVTGTNVFDERDRSFEFSPGPIFANVVLADEINRAPPKTQAALLEAMEERQVTVDGETHELPEPFFVIATQNPVEQEGTFPLPEAQLDRFVVETAMGYPDLDGETELLRRRAGRAERSPTVEAVVDEATVSALRAAPEDVRVDEDLLSYVAELGRATREDNRVEVGVSPRGVQRLFEAARAKAVLEGRAFVTPDDVADVVTPVFAHRLVLTADATVSGIEKRAGVADAPHAAPVPTVD
jgi:MoxR-like ATPase